LKSYSFLQTKNTEQKDIKNKNDVKEGEEGEYLTAKYKNQIKGQNDTRKIILHS